ncbi:MAG: preprotein translocase subunit SecG [Cryomorphaceae bacterium]|nr:preprotein translocase subunit SecG [Cryomorphaceae bacterium]
MELFLSALIIIVSILLILIIMVQNPKGGGLSSTFGGGGGTQLFGGVKKAGDLLDRSTWGLAIALCVLALMINVTVGTGEGKEEGSVATDREIAPQEVPANQGGQQGGEMIDFMGDDEE